MDFQNLRILLTDGDGRQTLTILHDLKELGCFVAVICSNKWNMCYVSNLPDRKLLYQAIGNALPRDEDYAEYILNLLKTGEYDVLFPVGEKMTNIVTAHEELFGKYVKLACAPRDAYIKVFNKQTTFEIAIQNRIPCPNTRRNEQSIDEYLRDAVFTIISKPRQGLGSVGFRKFETELEFRNALTNNLLDPDEYVIQEFIHFNKRIDAFLFIDKNGEVKTSMAIEVLRWYPLDAGTSTFTRTVDNPDVIKYGSEILRALHFQGLADVSFMIEKQSGQLKLMEINGRIPAGIKLSWYCGYNVARQLVEMAYGCEAVSYPENKKFGMNARHSQADLMWFIKSKDRFKARPSWFDNRNTTDLVYWKGDIKPYIFYSLRGLFKYKRFMKKREHCL